jgi:hypothetical protein
VGRLGEHLKRLGVPPVDDLLHGRADGPGGVLEGVAAAGRQRALGHPADRRIELTRSRRLVFWGDEHVAPADVDVGRQRHADRHRRHRAGAIRIQRVDRANRRLRARRGDDDLIPDVQRAGRELTGVDAALALACPRDPLDRKSQMRALEVTIGGHVDGLEDVQQRTALIPRRPR